MSLWVSWFISLFLLSASANSGVNLPGQWRSLEKKADVAAYQPLLDPSEMMSCRHLERRLQVRERSYEGIQWAAEILQQLEGTTYSEFNEVAWYYFSRLKFHEDRQGTQDVFEVEWDPASIGVDLDRADALLMVHMGQVELSRLDKTFPSHRTWLLEGGSKVRSRVRTVDVCWPGQISLVKLTQCPIDRSQFEGCLGSNCLTPEPVVFWRECKGEVLHLDLTSLSSVLGRRPIEMGRKSNRGQP